MDVDLAPGIVVKPFRAREAIGIFLAFILVMAFATVLTSLGMATFFAPQTTYDEQEIFSVSSAARVLLPQFVGVLAAAGITICLTRSHFPGSIKGGALVEIGFAKSTTRWRVASFAIGFFVSWFCSRVLSEIFPPNPDFVPSSLMSAARVGGWVSYLVFFMAVCLAPIYEELLFRGILYRGFSKSWGKLLAGGFVSIIFVLVHYETLLGGYWLSIAALTLLSFLLILVREISGSLLPPVLMHLGFNLSLVLPV